MRIKKYAAALLAATTVLGSLAACGEKKTIEEPTKGATTPEPTKGPEPTKEPDAITTPAATPIPDRDLGGMEIIIGDHWSPETPAEPVGAKAEATAAYRQDIMKKYHFKIQSKSVAGWGEMTDTCVNSITSGDPAAQLFELDYRFVSKPMSQGLFYDLGSLSELDFTEEKWNKYVLDLMTKGDSVYGMRAGVSEPRGGVIWNKRLFEEAGLDPNLPYDLQASGEWTWSKFEELCAKLTRDTNGDGVTDIYATVSQGACTCECLVVSNGTQYVGIDENGKLFNNSGSAKVLEALNFAYKLYNLGYEMPQPEGANWDWFIPAFQEGKAAMQFNEEYTCQPSGQPYGDENMEDEVGFVFPPKPDGAETYRSYVCDNITIIPSCFDKETASKIAFGYNVYTMNTPGYDDPLDWLNDYYSHFNDERAVDETIIMFNDPKHAEFLSRTLVPWADSDYGALAWAYPFKDSTPADKVAEIKDAWDAKIAEGNK